MARASQIRPFAACEVCHCYPKLPWFPALDCAIHHALRVARVHHAQAYGTAEGPTLMLLRFEKSHETAQAMGDAKRRGRWDRQILISYSGFLVLGIRAVRSTWHRRASCCPVQSSLIIVVAHSLRIELFTLCESFSFPTCITELQSTWDLTLLQPVSLTAPVGSEKVSTTAITITRNSVFAPVLALFQYSSTPLYCMPSDTFYGGTCFEIPFSNDIMNNHFSEPDWTTSNPVRSVQSL